MRMIFWKIFKTINVMEVTCSDQIRIITNNNNNQINIYIKKMMALTNMKMDKS